MYFYIRWKRYYCPHCGKWTGTHVVSSPRVGRETEKCASCSTEYRTLNLEWRSMTKGQRIGYFISEWTIGWLLFFFLVGLTFEGPTWWRLSAGFLLGLACCVPFVIYKLFRVRKSIRRFRLYPERNARNATTTLVG